MTYHLGPGPAKVHMAIASEWTQKPIYDVIAKIQGSDYPDEWVVRGNHHDGWVFGAWDPPEAVIPYSISSTMLPQASLTPKCR